MQPISIGRSFESSRRSLGTIGQFEWRLTFRALSDRRSRLQENNKHTNAFVCFVFFSTRKLCWNEYENSSSKFPTFFVYGHACYHLRVEMRKRSYHVVFCGPCSSSHKSFFTFLYVFFMFFFWSENNSIFFHSNLRFLPVSREYPAKPWDWREFVLLYRIRKLATAILFYFFFLIRRFSSSERFRVRFERESAAIAEQIVHFVQHDSHVRSIRLARFESATEIDPIHVRLLTN